MAVSAAQLLDELMGKDRNRAPGEPSSRMHWSDSEVCKYFLCGFCPHELFTNTKADLGACPKAHDEALKKEYEKSNRRGLMGYEETFHRFLQGIMADVERRIRRGHERLALNAKKEQQELKTAKGDDDQLSMITDHINQLLGEIETLGSEGKVEEAQGIMKLVDQLKEEKETLMQMSKLNPLSSQEKQMEVCEICGAFLIVGDAQSRVDDHLQGKQHVGYARIKAAVEDMKEGKWRTKIREEKEKKEKGAEEGGKDSKDEKAEVSSRSREGSRRKDRERSRDRNRSKERKDRNRSRDRRRDRDRRRSRSKDRRSRSRERRSRSRERRSRSRERRSKSRDRYRHRSSRDKKRSRSRERRRSRSRDKERRRSRSRERSRRSRSRSRERKKRSRSRDRRRSRSRSQSRSRKRESAESERSYGRKENSEEGNEKSKNSADDVRNEANGDTEAMQEQSDD
ncbi:luc7-like protein 3 [Rhopilema esculentum]|uniref:luc7-like protein 3 n=1 Tax=Rhopilema esculentum TaxID=499914 RepID=UPI0031D6549D